MLDGVYNVKFDIDGIANASSWIVQLVCPQHCQSEVPNNVALKLATKALKEKQYKDATINHAEVAPQALPLSFGSGNATYTDACGCRAWLWH